jgi:hypothetical protein
MRIGASPMHGFREGVSWENLSRNEVTGGWDEGVVKTAISMKNPPSESIILRPAARADDRAIRARIRAERPNPSGGRVATHGFHARRIETNTCRENEESHYEEFASCGDHSPSGRPRGRPRHPREDPRRAPQSFRRSSSHAWFPCAAYRDQYLLRK